MIPPNVSNVKTICALYAQGDVVHVALVSRASGGQASPATSGASGAEIVVHSTHTVPLAADQAAWESILQAYPPDVFLRVIPAGQSIARLAELPRIGPDEASGSAASASEVAISDALALLAETDLPSALPSYRRAAGVVTLGKRQVALLTGWPPTSEDQPTGMLRSLQPQVGIASAAALAALVKACPGTLAAWNFESGAGSITAIGVGPERSVLRSGRVPINTGQEDAAAFLDETLASADVDPALAPDSVSGGVQLVPGGRSVRIGQQPRDATWISAFGLPVAAAAVYFDSSLTVAQLAGLYLTEPQTKPPMFVRLTKFLARPAVAAIIVVGSLITLGFLPIGASMARTSILSGSVPDEAKLLASNAEAESELAFYRTLRDRRWPMAKVLADVAGACPVGIKLEALELTQADAGVIIRGKADKSETLTSFRENLGKTRVFSDISLPTQSPSDDGVQFQLTAKIPAGAAAMDTKPIDDFAAKTLAERMYGDGARAGPGGRTARGDRTGRSGTAAGSRRPDASRPGTSTSTTASGGQPSRAVEIPPAITDAEIAKLSATDAMAEFGKRRRAAAQPGLDEAVKRRLTDEAEKARARMREAMQAGGAGASSTGGSTGGSGGRP